MKGVVLALLLSLCICVNAYAIDWYSTNQATVEWDYESTWAEWVNSGVNNKVKFNLYLKNSTDGTPVILTPDPISEVMYTVTLRDEGKYFIGVSAVKMLGNEVVSESEISWSDVPEVCASLKDFGIKYFTQLNQPLGLRRY